MMKLLDWRLGVLMINSYLLLLTTAVTFLDTIASITDPSETAALVAFKATVRDSSNNLLNWKGNDPCGDSWKGVLCNQSDYLPNANLKYSHVTELRLLNFNLHGTLAPELGNLTSLKYLDVMWNGMYGSIPPSIGKLKNLFALTLSGNNFTGTLPSELGNLTNLNRFQIDENEIQGPIPPEYQGMVALQHLHFNNNSLSGGIPPQLATLPYLVHILVDNNQLTEQLPKELASAPSLTILQADNNNLSGTTIPPEYGNFMYLAKLSLRNCSLEGNISKLGNLANLSYLDLSFNKLTGSIPYFLSENITSINLSANKLSGKIPDSFELATNLQYLGLQNNVLNGSIPSFDATQRNFDNDTLVLDFQNNSFDYVSLLLVSTSLSKPNLHVRLSGNSELCLAQTSQPDNAIGVLCKPAQGEAGIEPVRGQLVEYQSGSSTLVVNYRLKSPSFYFFGRYYSDFIYYIANGLSIETAQIEIQQWSWQPGPRLAVIIVLYPSGSSFSPTESARIESLFGTWELKNSTLFGPYELLGFSQYESESKLSTGAIAGLAVASAAVVAFVIVGGFYLYLFKRRQKLSPSARRALRLVSKSQAESLMKITGVQNFTYKELASATDHFSDSMQIGRGGYGKVYRGVLEDGEVVAIKRSEEGSLQGPNEFYTEIELLSRCHHLNLVSLVGFCNDEVEQMLVYEFISGGNLQEHLSSKKPTLDFPTRLRIALGAAKGILYLHTEANPPVYHRDIKASNILLTEKREAKVSDFGLSRLAPMADFEGYFPTHVSTLVKGTPGYLDPEYFLTHQLTDKSDVYSFGVVLLELLTGQPPISRGKNIVREFRAAFAAGEMLSMLDPKMDAQPADVVHRFALLALDAVQDLTDNRPNMTEVVRTLEDCWKSVRETHVGVSISDSVDDIDAALLKSGHSPPQRSVPFGRAPLKSILKSGKTNDDSLVVSDISLDPKDAHVSPR